MYHLFGADIIFENILSLAKPFAENSIENLKDAKIAYVKLLNFHQPKIFRDATLKKKFLLEEEEVNSAILNFLKKSLLTDKTVDIEPTPSKSMHVALERIKKAISRIDEINSVLGEIIDLVLTTIFFARSQHQGGGSSSNAVGLLWCSNSPDWSEDDTCEFVIHELTHQLLFIDEMKHGHYSSLNQLKDPETFSSSAILNEKRPLDKVIHSLVVALEVLKFRKKNQISSSGGKVHPSNEAIIIQAHQTLNDLYKILDDKADLLLPRAKKIIETCHHYLKTENI